MTEPEYEKLKKEIDESQCLIDKYQNMLGLKYPDMDFHIQFIERCIRTEKILLGVLKAKLESVNNSHL